MEEALALINSISDMIKEAKPTSFGKKKNAIVDRDDILNLLEKLRLVVTIQSDLPINATQNSGELVGETHPELFGLEGEALLRQAKAEADKIKNGADKNAESVFNNMLITLSKSATAIKNGKERINKYKSGVQN